MKNSVLLAGLAGVLLATAAAAQTRPDTDLPPPSINDPGVTPTPAATAPQAAKTSGDALPGGVVPHTESPPEVNIRRQGEDIVQEYSHGGRVYMIKVIPAKGVTQTYRDINNDGRLDLEPGQAPVAPVYYTIYQWDKPKPGPKGNSGD